MYPKAPLPVTEKLGHSVLALPFTLDMNQSHVAQIVTTLGTILRGRNDIHLSMLPVSERAVGFNE
jgi:dTDP-4-amino-4,6-dideoxygalactose transaminase